MGNSSSTENTVYNPNNSSSTNNISNSSNNTSNNSNNIQQKIDTLKLEIYFRTQQLQNYDVIEQGLDRQLAQLDNEITQLKQQNTFIGKRKASESIESKIFVGKEKTKFTDLKGLLSHEISLEIEVLQLEIQMLSFELEKQRIQENPSIEQGFRELTGDNPNLYNQQQSQNLQKKEEARKREEEAFLKKKAREGELLQIREQIRIQREQIQKEQIEREKREQLYREQRQREQVDSAQRLFEQLEIIREKRRIAFEQFQKEKEEQEQKEEEDRQREEEERQREEEERQREEEEQQREEERQLKAAEEQIKATQIEEYRINQAKKFYENRKNQEEQLVLNAEQELLKVRKMRDEQKILTENPNPTNIVDRRRLQLAAALKRQQTPAQLRLQEISGLDQKTQAEIIQLDEYIQEIKQLQPSKITPCNIVQCIAATLKVTPDVNEASSITFLNNTCNTQCSLCMERLIPSLLNDSIQKEKGVLFYYVNSDVLIGYHQKCFSKYIKVPFDFCPETRQPLNDKSFYVLTHPYGNNNNCMELDFKGVNDNFNGGLKRKSIKRRKTIRRKKATKLRKSIKFRK